MALSPTEKTAQEFRELVNRVKGAEYLSKCDIQVNVREPTMIRVQIGSSDQCYQSVKTLTEIIKDGPEALERFIDEERRDSLLDHPGRQYGY